MCFSLFETNNFWNNLFKILIVLFIFFSCASPLQKLKNMQFSKDSRKKVLILISEDITNFLEVKNKYEQEIEEGYEFLSLNLEGSHEELGQISNFIQRLNPDLILCIGAVSLSSVAGRIVDKPILFSMVLDYQKFHIQKYNNIAGVSLEIPPEMIFYNFKSIIGDISKVGVISGERYYTKLLQIKQNLQKQDINLVVKKCNTPQNVVRSYESVKDSIQAIWMFPDPEITNEENFLYLAVEDKLSFIVYSENFVKAGGLFSVSPNYSTIGSQLAIMTQQILEDSIQPAQIGVSPIIGTFLTVNKTTLRKLGLNANYGLVDKSFE